MREIVHLQAGQCGNQIGAKVGLYLEETKGANRSRRRAVSCVNSCANSPLFVSFGKLSQTNMELIQLVHITVIPTSS